MADTDFTVPDGGMQAWTTSAGAWLVMFASLGYLYSFGVYEDFYVVEFLTNHTASSIAWIGSFQLMAPFLLGVVAGKLFDNGHFHAIQIFGGATFIFSQFIHAFTCKTSTILSSRSHAESYFSS
ncbi:MFS general substrate transporter [Mycena venus]|uniref:MFS general substrate transporter n=1 Tax=Mycena venus TaxID=2733690 RepID=A0A8H7D8P8_9AGAR|nr:MFS general substrate transporter [Mycena venus]